MATKYSSTSVNTARLQLRRDLVVEMAKLYVAASPPKSDEDTASLAKHVNGLAEVISENFCTEKENDQTGDS